MIKMEVVLAENYGMCEGVKRALKMAEREAAKRNGSIYTLGPLVHNAHVTGYFEGKGIYAAESIDDIGSGTVIIRAHGVPDSEKEKARKKSLNVVDATCTLVLKLKDTAERFEREGYQVIVYGENSHPEIMGITGNLKSYLIVENIDEAVIIGDYERIGLVSQTTKMQEQYEWVQKELRGHCSHLEIGDTICLATQKRQESARETAKKADIMVVIGDNTSSNSKNLLKACKETNDNTFFIRSREDLKKEYFNGVSSIGLTAGASVPDWIINEVLEALRGM